MLYFLLFIQVCYKEFETKAQALQCFHFAYCGASRPVESSIRERMANKALCEAQLSHLSVTTGSYRMRKGEILLHRVHAQLSHVWPRMSKPEHIDGLHKEAQNFGGEAGSHILEAMAALNKAHSHHLAARRLLYKTPVYYKNGEAITKEEAINDNIEEALGKLMASWMVTLSRHNLSFSPEKLSALGNQFDGVEMASGSFSQYNVGIQELLKSVAKWAFMVNRFLSLLQTASLSNDNVVPTIYNAWKGNSASQQGEKMAGKGVWSPPEQRNVRKVKSTPATSKKSALGNSKKLNFDEEKEISTHNSGSCVLPLVEQLSFLSLEGSTVHDKMTEARPRDTSFVTSCEAGMRMDQNSKLKNISRVRRKCIGACMKQEMKAIKRSSSSSSTAVGAESPIYFLGELMERIEEGAKSKEKIGEDNSFGNRSAPLCSRGERKKLGADIKTGDLKSVQKKTGVALKNDDTFKRKPGRPSRYRGRQQVGENKENAEGLLSTLAELSRNAGEEVDSGLANVVKGKASVLERSLARPRRVLRKDKASPECSRYVNKSLDDECLTTLDVGCMTKDVFDRLALSPDFDSSPGLSNHGRVRSYLSCAQPVLSEPVTNSLPDASCSSFSPSLSSQLEQSSELFYSFTGDDCRNGQPDSSVGLLSPIEIPRGRPQRTKRATQKISSGQVGEDEQSVRTPSPLSKSNKEEGEKENVIQCTPEREIGKSPFPLLTPKTKAKSKLSLKKSKDQPSQTVTKRRALKSREDSDNILSNETGENATSKLSTSAKARTMGTSQKKAAQHKEGGKKSEPENKVPEVEEEAVKRKISRKPRRGVTRGKTACTGSRGEDSLTSVKGKNIDTTGGDLMKSPCKRHSEDHNESLGVVSDKSPRKESTPQTIESAIAQKNLERIKEQSNPEYSQTKDGHLSTKQRVIKPFSLTVKHGSGDALSPKGKDEALKKELDEIEDESLVVENDSEMKNGAASKSDTKKDSEETVGCIYSEDTPSLAGTHASAPAAATSSDRAPPSALEAGIESVFAAASTEPEPEPMCDCENCLCYDSPLDVLKILFPTIENFELNPGKFY